MSGLLALLITVCLVLTDELLVSRSVAELLICQVIVGHCFVPAGLPCSVQRYPLLRGSLQLEWLSLSYSLSLISFSGELLVYNAGGRLRNR